MPRERPSVPLDRLEQAAGQLRPLEREVLRLSAYDQLSSAEIAARLGLNAERVERLLAHALCRIDRMLDRQRRPRWRFW